MRSRETIEALQAAVERLEEELRQVRKELEQVKKALKADGAETPRAPARKTARTPKTKE